MRLSIQSCFPLSLLALATALLPASVGVAASPSLDQLVPAGPAFFVALEDMPNLRANFGRSAPGLVWNEPEIERFLAPLWANPGYTEMLKTLEEESGSNPSELLGFATGDVLLTVPADSLKLNKSKGDADALLMIEVGENQPKILELISQHQAKVKADGPVVDTTEDYNGVTLNMIAKKDEAEAPAESGEGESPEPAKQPVWAIHEGRWIIGTNRALVTGALDALAAGGLAEALAGDPAYRVLQDGASGMPSFSFRVDFRAIYPVLVASIEAERDPQQPPNPMGADPLNIVNALGLDALNGLSGAGRIAEDGAMTGDFALTYSEARGLVNLLAYRDGPVTKPDWVPAAWVNVSSQNFSLGDVYEELERILDRVSPMLSGMALGQVRAFDRQLKIDIKRDLVGNLGPAMISAVTMPGGASAENPPAYDEMEQFFAFALADSAAFERTVEALKGKFLPPTGGPLETREYLGRKLHVFSPTANGAPGAKGFAYAITDGWLLVGIGSSGPVEAAIQGMHKPDAAASFWARSDMRPVFEAMPAAAISVQATDLSTLFASLCVLAVKTQADQESTLVDAAAVPATAVFSRHFGPASGYGERRTDGLYFHSHLPASKAVPATAP